MSEANFDRIVSLLTSADSPLESGHLQTVEEGRTYFPGTTTQVLGGGMVVAASGLWVPESASTSAAPIDLIQEYVTFSQVTDLVAPLPVIIAELRKYRLSQMLGQISLLTSDLHRAAGLVDRLERSFAALFTVPGHRVLYAQLVAAGHPVVTSQALAVLTKLSLLHSDDQGMDPPEHLFVQLCLQISDHLGSDRTISDDDRLAAEVAAAQWHWRSLRIPTIGSLFVDRWSEPQTTTGLDVPRRYEESVGHSLEVLTGVAVALLAPMLHRRDPAVDRSHFRALGYPRREVTAALRRISATVPQMNRKIASELQSDGDLRWNFECFDRYPVLRLPGGRYLVTDDYRLMRRVLGWGVIYEAGEAMTGSQRRRFYSQVERQAETYAMQVIRQAYESSNQQRLFSERELKAAYPGDGIRVADAAVDFGTDWAVIEICSARPRRGVLSSADPAAFRQMIDQVLDEADQAYATARNITANPENLVPGSPTTVTVWPLVLMTEGFPINPIVHERLRRLIDDRRWADSRRIEPLEVIDQEELNMVQQLAAAGVSLPTLLRRKHQSNFLYDSLRNFIVATPELKAMLDPRRDTSWTSLFDRVVSRLRTPPASRR